MAKGQRSKHKRALRAIRRDKVATWKTDADKKRLEALARDIAAEPKPVPQEPEAAPEGARGRDDADVMAVDQPHPSSQKQKLKCKRQSLGAKGGLQKRKKQRKVGVLSGINQFHKKGKKGTKGRK